MANRIVRENILTSDAVNKLTWSGEVFYRRLMSVADDFGRYDGRPSILRTALYSLRIDKVSEADVAKWIDECQEAGLVSLYHVEGKPYLEILKFCQRLRQMKSKYPSADGGQSSAECGQLRPEEKRIGRESEVATTDSRQEKLYEMFSRITTWKAEVISQQVALFMNKYPEVPINKTGQLVNAWANNLHKPKSTHNNGVQI